MRNRADKKGPAMRYEEGPVAVPSAVSAGAESVRGNRHSAAGEAEALPDYLLRHYWWAYVWPPAVWFFDHQPIINLIVFGQYRRLVAGALEAMTPEADGANLLIGSAYGCFVPELADRLGGQSLDVVDVAPIQLRRAEVKLGAPDPERSVTLSRMNAEHLTCEDDSYDRALMFLLLHELPVAARARALEEAVRVIRPGGELVMSEYGAITRSHPFHRIAPMRWGLGVAEPFLPSLWRTDLDRLVDECAGATGKRAVCESTTLIFGGFYRSVRYRIQAR